MTPKSSIAWSKISCSRWESDRSDYGPEKKKRGLAFKSAVMKTYLCSIFLPLFLSPLVSSAAFGSSPLATAPCRVVLEESRATSGGGAWPTVRTLHIHMKLASGGREGTYDSWEDVSTGRFFHEASLPPRVLADGFDGVSVWTQPDSGVAYSIGDEDARLGAIDESFRVARAWWFADRRASTCEDAGQQIEGNRTFDLVRITPEGGRALVLWIDHATHLIDRDSEQEAEQLSVVYFADYRSVNGVLLPFTIRHGDGASVDGDVETVLTVDINPQIPDGRFSLPALPSDPSASPNSVSLPFRLENNQILVNVTINGKGPYEADFDSGGSLILPPVVVSELGATSRGSSKETGGGEASVTGTRGIVNSLSLGSAVLGHVSFQSFAWDDEHPKRLLIGLEVLQHFVVRIDFDAMMMTLTSPDVFHYAGEGAVVPFHFQDNQPEVFGAVDGIAGVFAVDTGDNGSLLLIAPFARRYGFVDRYHATIPYGGSAVTATHGAIARAATVKLNGADGRPVASVSKPITRISLQHSGFDANRYVSGNIGIGILKQFNVTFDYRRQRIILERNHLYGLADVFDRSGMYITAQTDGWVVDTVYVSGPAEQAGVRQGDVILSIDGKNPSMLDRSALRAAMTRPVGTAVELLVRSDGVDRKVVITLREVL
jgi:hypothetical protein